MDDKIGHIRQSEGLAFALQKQLGKEISIETLPAFSVWTYIQSFGQCTQKIECNSIVIGAGHRTHFGLLYYKWKYRAKSIVIMKPSMPKIWFDYCIVPKHDGLPEQGNVLVTEGAMNALSLMAAHKEEQVLILIGGPSNNCQWQNERIYQQLLEMLPSENENKIIKLSTSRRTPQDFIENCPDLIRNRVELIDFISVDASWLPEQLLKSQTVWCTADSVSMIYEALSAGCDVKTIAVDGLTGKIAQNLAGLVNDGWVNSDDSIPTERLNESERIAKKLLELGLMND